MDVFEVQHSKRRGYMFGYKQDQSFCWHYHYQFVMSAKARLNSSAQDYYPQVIACSSVSLTAFLKKLSVCSVATNKYANGGAVGF